MTSTLPRSLPLLLVVLLVACTGSVEGGGGRADGGAGSDGGGLPGSDGGGPGVDGSGSDSGGGGGSDGGGPGTDGGPVGFDAGPCSGLTLATALSTVSLAGASASGDVFAAPTSDNGAVVAVETASGARIQRFTGAGAAVGSAIDVAGNGLWGFDASADTWAVMVSRGTDALYLVAVEPSAAMRFEVKLLGEVDHMVTNNEWFGTGIRYGRLLWDGTRWATYYTVNRLWPDGIAHYGDQLRFFDASGGDDGTAWGWGCSHSMEVRIAHNGTTLAPVCASDCFPEKGIHVNHRSAMLYPDEGGSNCAGRYGTTLGGVVPTSDGFWVTFTATDARASHDVAVIHVANDYTPGSPIWLTADAYDDANVHAARYGAGFVVAWTGMGGTDRIARLDTTGTVVEGPVDVPTAALAGASDFFLFSNGDVGWATGSGQLARLRSCE